MRQNNEWLDLPSLTLFKGNMNAFRHIGSVVLESTFVWVCECRHPDVTVQRFWVRYWLLLLHVFGWIIWYVFCHLLIILMPTFSRMKSKECGGHRTPLVVAFCEVFVREYYLDSPEDDSTHLLMFSPNCYVKETKRFCRSLIAIFRIHKLTTQFTNSRE